MAAIAWWHQWVWRVGGGGRKEKRKREKCQEVEEEKKLPCQEEDGGSSNGSSSGSNASDTTTAKRVFCVCFQLAPLPSYTSLVIFFNKKPFKTKYCTGIITLVYINASE